MTSEILFIVALLGLGVALLLPGTFAGAARSRLNPATQPSQVTRARREVDLSTPLIMELTGAALKAGMPLAHAVELVAQHSHGKKGLALTRLGRALEIGTPFDVAWQGSPSNLQPLRRALTLGNGTGAELSNLLFLAATDVRNSTKRECEADVAQLAVHLMLPSGLFSLPAFVCLGIVPVLISLVGKGW